MRNLSIIYQYINITWLLLTEKYLCWSVILILSFVKFLRAPILKNICDRQLLKMCSWDWEKCFHIFKNLFKGVLILHLKNRFFQHQYQKQVYDRYFMIGFSWSLYSHTIFLRCGEKSTLITKYLELIKRRSKVQEKNMSCERALNFDQWKTFSENYKPMRIWFWSVYKFTEN